MIRSQVLKRLTTFAIFIVFCTSIGQAQMNFVPIQQLSKQQKQKALQQLITRYGKDHPAVKSFREQFTIEGNNDAPVAKTGKAKKKKSAEDDERTTAMKERLNKLTELSFNRLPSAILKTWANPNGNKDKDELEKIADIPPAPRKAFLYSDTRFAAKMEEVKSQFTLGEWDAMKTFMELLPDENRPAVYAKLLSAITGENAQTLEGNSGADDADSRAAQTQFFSYEDILEIARIAPKKLKDDQINKLAVAFRVTTDRGSSVEELVEMFNVENKKEKPVLNKRHAAKILMAMGRPIEAGDFLPELTKAKKDNDHEALNLLSRHYLADYAKDKETKQLEEAWHVTQAILAADDVEQDERKQALKRAVSLSRKVKKELGQEWLNQSFIQHPERGIEVLSAIGADTSIAMLRYPHSTSTRFALLKLQHDAIEALLEANPKRKGMWQQSLNLLAQNWLREASVSYTDDESSSLGPSMQRDRYGNIFYFDDDYYERRNRYRNGNLSPIETAQLLEVKPSEAWLELVDPNVRPRFDMIQAQLYLKVSEDELALPFIEKLAATHPQKAENLVNEFLQVWTENHNPNSSRRRTNHYMYMYGYESRAESIPLTRSKQKRNLEELSALVPKLNSLIEGEVKQELVLEAFFTVHSTAEVYKKSDIETVFGEFKGVKPEIVSDLAQRMRGNLATMWRDATVQKKSKTKRKKVEIQQEVIRGYEVARSVVDEAIRNNPDEWSLMVVDASLMHDENNYRAELKNSTKFSDRRGKAMARFKEAADKYAEVVEGLEEKDYSTKAYETWFYASLGACDLGLIKPTNQRDEGQTELIRDSIASLPEKKRKWHEDRFANLLFNRMSAAKAEVKHSYLDAGFEIVGDNKQAAEAKKVHDYYKDLVTEIRLDARVDGDDQVGTEPFGVFVSLKHTKEIERESGGFGRYLQNQNSGGYWSYNYGRPTEDYRDKFDETIREAMEDHFEVMSVTFQAPDVKSITTKPDGWKETPYAYVLLKSLGPEVDKVPPMKINMDFLDTSGYAILPVESPAIPIDSTLNSDEPRPYNNLQLTQILDERQADEGKLVVEVKAVADGLVPDVKDIVDLDSEYFEVKNVDDQGLAVSRFDAEGDGKTIISERSWLVSLEAKPGLGKPSQFNFPTVLVDTEDITYQRYVDADLVSVTADIELEEKYGSPNYKMWGVLGGVGLLGLLLFGGAFAWLSRPPKNRERKSYKIDENPSPFSTISLLQDIQRNNGLTERKKEQLGQSINRLEQYYFGSENGNQGPEPDLAAEIRKWTKRTK